MIQPTDIIGFGKHKGKTFLEVATKYPYYIIWLEEKKVINVGQKIRKVAHDSLNKLNN